jgi:hypothetical protein
MVQIFLICKFKMGYSQYILIIFQNKQSHKPLFKVHHQFLKSRMHLVTK